MSAPTAVSPPLTRADGSAIRALVVDDEPALGELLSNRVHRCAARVRVRVAARLSIADLAHTSLRQEGPSLLHADRSERSRFWQRAGSVAADRHRVRA